MNIKVNLQPLVNNLNLPTVLKTAILPGDSFERLFIATQVGEIYYIGNGVVETLLDIRQRIIKQGTANSGYDERGLLGLAFHPKFNNNGLFYLHYSVADAQGPGAIPVPFRPNPCDPETLNLQWLNREINYDHIDTVEEWVLQANGRPKISRTLLNLRRPFANHNGVNSLNFSPESGKLVLTTGDGGAGYDPFNLSQNDIEIAGKIIEIDVDMDVFINNPPVVTRFDELPYPIIDTLTVIAKGVRNIPGISYQWYYNQYIKYVGNVGQDLVESIYAFTEHKPIPVAQLIEDLEMNSKPDLDGFINFGWRGWEGIFPTTIISECSDDESINEKTIAFYNDAVETSELRIHPLTCYYHQDPRPDKFNGTALTGVHPYIGKDIPELTGCVLFTDFVQDEGSQPGRGVLAYTRVRDDCIISEYNIIETNYDFGTKSSYYVSLGANLDQTRLYLGVYGSTNVTNHNLGTVFEIVP
ncbi:MAG: glucose dehydrogenase [Anaerocolumna sp.]|jgi:hypothetical protein|nr:glucose dehydrogenase [Anaerocolumna sp.]